MIEAFFIGMAVGLGVLVVFQLADLYKQYKATKQIDAYCRSLVKKIEAERVEDQKRRARYEQ